MAQAFGTDEARALELPELRMDALGRESRAARDLATVEPAPLVGEQLADDRLAGAAEQGERAEGRGFRVDRHRIIVSIFMTIVKNRLSPSHRRTDVRPHPPYNQPPIPEEECP